MKPKMQKSFSLSRNLTRQVSRTHTPARTERSVSVKSLNKSFINRNRRDNVTRMKLEIENMLRKIQDVKREDMTLNSKMFMVRKELEVVKADKIERNDSRKIQLKRWAVRVKNTRFSSSIVRKFPKFEFRFLPFFGQVADSDPYLERTEVEQVEF